MASGPLGGVKVLELAGIGPGPFCGMLLSDLGADVIRVDRAQQVSDGDAPPNLEPMYRGRRSIGVDLKHADGVELVLDLVAEADALIEGFRPGVTERLGVGPDACFARNPRLVYGRMTGYGQDGPYAQMAGHDINYVAVGGALAHLGRAGEKPTPPINLVGDFGGGAMFLALGVVSGILHARATGEGQVVDAAMVDGVATLMSMMWGLRHIGAWDESRGTNVLDTGAPFYDTYETKDGRYVAIGALEPQFYAELLERLGIDASDLPPQMDRNGWPELRRRFSEVFASKTRAEWDAVFEGTDACYAPVLTMTEACTHPHLRARSTLLEDGNGVWQPAPAPRFSRTPGSVQRPAPNPGADTDDVLHDWGIADDRIRALRDSRAIG